MLLSNWEEPHPQHDVCEFLSYTGNYTQMPMLQGRWEARMILSDGERVATMDRGMSTQPLELELPDVEERRYPTEVQSMIAAWGNQHYKFAFTAAPPVLILRLPRFKIVGNSVNKSSDRYDWGRSINLPIFAGNRLEVYNQEYIMYAGICHHGITYARTLHVIPIS